MPEPVAPGEALEQQCPQCGYDLRGLRHERCPECGLDLSFVESTASLVPWEHRRAGGRVGTYWLTVARALTRPKRFCFAAAQPVDYASARRFHLVTWLHVVVALAIAVGALWIAKPNMVGNALDELGPTLAVLTIGCWLLTLYLLIGVPSYFFHPKRLTIEQQNRAVALSYYAAAPLALLLPLTLAMLPLFSAIDPPLPTWVLVAALTFGGVLLVGGVFRLGGATGQRSGGWAILAALVLLAIAAALIGGSARPDDRISAFALGVGGALLLWMVLWFSTLMQLAVYLLQGTWPRLRLWLVPIAWALVALLFGVLLPASFFYLAVIYYSLQPLPGL